ncbi:MAG: macro domain-containing protein [Bradyrhizobium sp.]
MFGGAIKSFNVGIRRRWFGGLTQALSAAGGIWLITEIATKVSDTAEHLIKDHGNYYSAFVLAVSTIWFLWHVYEVRSVAFNLPTTDTRIRIRYGDLFEQPTDWLIGVGEFFDSDVGHVVSQNSLHGKLINITYGGDTALFRALVERFHGSNLITRPF